MSSVCRGSSVEASSALLSVAAVVAGVVVVGAAVVVVVVDLLVALLVVVLAGVGFGVMNFFPRGLNDRGVGQNAAPADPLAVVNLGANLLVGAGVVVAAAVGAAAAGLGRLQLFPEEGAFLTLPPEEYFLKMFLAASASSLSGFGGLKKGK